MVAKKMVRSSICLSTVNGRASVHYVTIRVLYMTGPHALRNEASASVGSVGPARCEEFIDRNEKFRVDSKCFETLFTKIDAVGGSRNQMLREPLAFWASKLVFCVGRATSYVRIADYSFLFVCVALDSR